MGYISLKNVQKIFNQGENEVRALNGIDLDIKEGEFIAILGQSGSGKSTLLNMLGGLDTITSGEIYVDGKEIGKYSENDLAKYRSQTIGFVFQSFNLIPVLTIEENICMPLLIDHKKMNQNHLDEIMKELDISNLKKRMPSQISGGQQQRVAIARALINNPKIILADEPTGNLDTKISNKVVTMLTDICKKYNKTLIMITHNEEIATYADRIIRIQDGKIINEELKCQ